MANGTVDILASIQIPTRMEYHLPLEAERELQPFPTQPEFSMYDANVSMEGFILWQSSEFDGENGELPEVCGELRKKINHEEVEFILCF